MSTADARVCACVLEEHPQKTAGATKVTEEMRGEGEGQREIKKVAGEMVDGKEGAGRGEEQGQEEIRGEEGA